MFSAAVKEAATSRKLRLQSVTRAAKRRSLLGENPLQQRRTLCESLQTGGVTIQTRTTTDDHDVMKSVELSGMELMNPKI